MSVIKALTDKSTFMFVSALSGKMKTSFLAIVLVLMGCSHDGIRPTTRFAGDVRLISVADVKEIEKVIVNSPSIDHRILTVSVKSEDRVDAWTGYVSGPICGSGAHIYLEKKSGRWVVAKKTRWVI